jgi:hypothetical protein
MPAFNVAVRVRLEATAEFEIKAKNEEAANEKAQALIDAGEIAITNWDVKESKKLEVAWDESDQTAEIDAVDEA